ncbi:MULTISPECIES: hypothetical protein [Aurantimonadaceae]|uniref:Uncharacterized protein n=1 Tax=Jiella pelagia TaxID=2986949 RepID=A0ABY7C9E4_9HYPH|nr:MULTISPECIES: hypothetical protein [Aurantimonadaceae]WAP71410.1 hypothetical protein OH818_28405 [Jiella pelagia]
MTISRRPSSGIAGRPFLGATGPLKEIYPRDKRALHAVGWHFSPVHLYCRTMNHARRILAVLLLLAFGLGTPAYAVQSGEINQAVIEAGMDMSQPAMAAGMEQSMPDGCDACGGNMAMSPSACFTTCVGVQDAAARSGLAFELSDAIFIGVPDRRLRSVQSAPEPFPPRLTILS